MTPAQRSSLADALIDAALAQAPDAVHLALPAADVPCYMCDRAIEPGEAFHVVTRYEGRVVAQVHDACERAWLEGGRR